MASAPAWSDPYLTWVVARAREGYAFDLGSSGLRLTWDLAAWGVAPAGIPLEGHNFGGTPALRRILAARLGLPPGRVLLAPGCTGANLAALATLTRPGDRVVLETPVYSPLRTLVRGLGLAAATLPRRRERRWGFDPAEAAAALEGARVLLVTNPHNPTGRLLEGAELRELAALADRGGAALVVDEVYREFPGGEAAPCAAALPGRILATGSLTKAYGLGGLRVGWIAAAEPLAGAAAAAVATLFGRGSVPGEALATHLLAHPRFPDLRREIAARVEAGRALAAAFAAARADVEWEPPDVGIVGLLKLPPDFSGHALAERARGEGLYLVPGEFFGAPGTLRLGFGAGREEVARGLEVLGRLLDAGAGRG